MNSSKQFLSQTCETASLAFREFFRPIIFTTRLLTFDHTKVESEKSSSQVRVSIDEAKAILRQRLAKGRSRERLLLTQAILSTLASVLATAISLLQTFQLPVFPLLIIIPISFIAMWLCFRIVKNREDIIEVKTLRWLVDSLEPDTADLVLKQIAWGKVKRKRRSKNLKKVGQ